MGYLFWPFNFNFYACKHLTGTKSQGAEMQIVYNWHITERCNYSCSYCFAKWNKSPEIWENEEFVDKILKELAQKDVISKKIGENVTQVRINFAGGEPLILGKDVFAKIVMHAKELGFETSLITNGSLLKSHPKIFEYLDMIGISIDSLDENICRSIGRCSGKNYLSVKKLSDIVDKIRLNNSKTKLKFNTVVSKNNCSTNIIEQLQAFKPDKIKILRQLPFNGEEGITDEQFEQFLNANKKFIQEKNIVIENKGDITQSYLMIDPQGRFFQNGNERDYKYSQSIYKVGLKRALSQIKFSKEKFMNRYKNTPKKITISGYAGTGKSSVGKALAEKLNYQFLSVGNFAREFAEKEFNMSINEFQEKCEDEPQLDDLVNYKFRDLCNGSENIVADFRLGFHFVEDSFNILFVVSEEEAFERIAKDNRKSEKTDFESIRKRNENMRHRFIEKFGADFADKNNYDLIIDTSKKTLNEIAEQILAAIKVYR
jgi:predicted cytidylate kinase